ncbi:MAG: DMT family transporter [Pseudomonadota bacterium]
MTDRAPSPPAAPGGLPRLAPLAAVLAIGAGWGLTTTAAKVAVSTGHHPIGLLFWHLVTYAVILTPVCLARGRPLPLTPKALAFYAGIAVLGNIAPGLAEFASAVHLPAGVLAIVVSTTPLLALALAALLRVERPTPARLAGVGLGALGIALLLGPEASLPDPSAWPWVLVLLIAPATYAAEGLWVSQRMPARLDPLTAVLGAALTGLAALAPAIAAEPALRVPLPGPFGPAEQALIAGGALSALCYAGYIAVARRWGPVFASLVAYAVTLSGVAWSILLLGERHSGWIWAALAAMIAGMALAQPRR